MVDVNYFIIILLILFPVFSLAAEKENNPSERFILDQSRLDSGAVLGGAEPDSESVQKAEAGDIEALVRLYEFYRDNGESQKADLTLYKAAEKGHIPSLKLIYQQTRAILLTGLEAAVSAHIFAPLRSFGGRTEFGLMQFSYMDHLSSADGLQEESSRFRSSIISQITDGETDSLVGMKTIGSSSLPKDGRGGESSRKVYDVVSLSPEANRVLHEGRDIGYHAASSKGDRTLRGQMDSLTMLGRYTAYRLENSTTQMEYWLGQLKRVADTGDMLALQMVYRITGEVLVEGYTKVVSSTIDSFFAEDREKGMSPKMTAMRNRESVRESVREQIKAPFVEGVEGLMFDLYQIHRAKGDAEKTANWLDQLKKVANEGSVPALRIVYHITGEVLTTGYNAVISDRTNYHLSESMGVSPKIAGKQSLRSIQENVMEQIKAPFGNKCVRAFPKK